MKLFTMLMVMTILFGCAVTDQHRESREAREYEVERQFAALVAKCRLQGGKIVTPPSRYGRHGEFTTAQKKDASCKW